MPVNKNAMLRYQLLDKCFRNTGRNYFIEDLIAECDRVLMEIAPNTKGISRRQIFEDIAFMESDTGWSIDLLRGKEGKRVFYRYATPSFSINNMPLNEVEIKHLQSAMDILSHFKGMPQFDWVHELLPKLKQGISTSAAEKTIIEFDSNQYLRGIEHLGTLYNAILYEKVLKIRYCPYVCEQAYEMTLHPYYLKQYNNRWFLFGYNPIKGKYDWNVALDRIEELNETAETYIPNTEIDWTEYFDDMIGVTKPENASMEKIVLHFYGTTGKYIETKPIHGSQKSKCIADDVLEVSLNVIVNYELTSLILSYAGSVKVMEPQSLAERIKMQMQKGVAQYKS
jgi:predicted DNA-binding transcriptional regulator YafY